MSSLLRTQSYGATAKGVVERVEQHNDMQRTARVGSVKEDRKRKRVIRKAYRAWDRERDNARLYGESHVRDIDAIFSREINRLEKG